MAFPKLKPNNRFCSLKFKLLLPYLLSICAFYQAASSLSFNFPSFNANNHDINYLKDASVVEGDIFLTKSETNFSVGRATYAQPLLLWDKASGKLADFSTSFSFVIQSQTTGSYGDGITFFLAHKDLPINGTAASALGLIPAYQTSQYPFLAVEFDTYSNEWDPKTEHIGFDLNSIISFTTLEWLCNTSIIYGLENFAQITYDSRSKNLSATVNTQQKTQTLSFVIDLRDHLPENVTIGFSASTGGGIEKNSLNSWNFSSTLEIQSINPTNTSTAGPSSAEVPPPSSAEVPPPSSAEVPPNSKSSEVTALIVVSSVVTFALFALLGCQCFIRMRRKNEREKEDEVALETSNVMFEMAKGPQRYSYNYLASATNNFSEQEKLGEGGFGVVYKGYLKDSNCFVAVKKISEESKQGKKEYESEVTVISRLRHKNLVQLMGWCHERTTLLLVYDYMANGSLDSHLFEENSTLAWELRYKIAQGLASGLLYLHEEWEQCVLHRDIKSSNVMLDPDFNAKLGDFGLARLIDHMKGSQTTDVVGTRGYMAPEYVTTGRASKESDVYSFGIVALEIACGRKAILKVEADGNQVLLVRWVWELYREGRLYEAVDPRLGGEYAEHEMELLLIVGLWCAHPDQKLRPSMRQVTRVLSFEAQLPAVPPDMSLPLSDYYASSFNLALALSSFDGITSKTTSSQHMTTASIKTTSSQHMTTASRASTSGPL